LRLRPQQPICRDTSALSIMCKDTPANL